MVYEHAYTSTHTHETSVYTGTPVRRRWEMRPTNQPNRFAANTNGSAAHLHAATSSTVTAYRCQCGTGAVRVSRYRMQLYRLGEGRGGSPAHGEPHPENHKMKDLFYHLYSPSLNTYPRCIPLHARTHLRRRLPIESAQQRACRLGMPTCTCVQRRPGCLSTYADMVKQRPLAPSCTLL